MKAVGYDKLLASRVEGQVSSCIVEGVMNRLLDDTDLDSKAPRRTEWDLVWDNGWPGVWTPDYREQYDMKDAEWRFYAVPQIMDRMNVSDYVDSDIKLKLRELEEEQAQQLAEMEAAGMRRG